MAVWVKIPGKTRPVFVETAEAGWIVLGGENLSPKEVAAAFEAAGASPSTTPEPPAPPVTATAETAPEPVADTQAPAEVPGSLPEQSQDTQQQDADKTSEDPAPETNKDPAPKGAGSGGGSRFRRGGAGA